MKKKILSIFLLIFTILNLTSIKVFSDEFYKNTNTKDKKMVEAKVTEIKSNSRMLVKITNGDHKGEIVETNNTVADNASNDSVSVQLRAQKGSRILLYIEEDSNGKIVYTLTQGFIKYKYIFWVVGLFCLLLILIGGKKGAKSLLTLIITGLLIIKVLVPLEMKGINPIIPTIIICILILLISYAIISGLNRKTYAAMWGTSIGILISGTLAIIIGNAAKLKGVDESTLSSLIYICKERFNFVGFLFSGILLSSLGAVMDVGISISSSMCEVEENNPEISNKDLLKSGMNVGRDIMGTMSNTLILAYAGEALAVLMIAMSYNMSFIETLNQDLIASEILKAVSGSIGIILTIPITAVLVIVFREKEKRDNKIEKQLYD
ncbi:YibE/F family protein [Haloimpatiens sp. FM7330]|uniref:YibE/F family protein n=1 Tax=Haloimpatiens sp. FM7330 TaxID=3298610 RepID=UPI00362FA124